MEIWQKTLGRHLKDAHAAGQRTVAAAAEHEAAVRKAVKEGKLVPGHALADYPDLMRVAANAARGKADDVASSMTMGGSENFSAAQREEHAQIAAIVGALGVGLGSNDR